MRRLKMAIRAYDGNYLELAQENLAICLDYAVNYLGMSLKKFWDQFLSSRICDKFMSGDTTTLAGRSGIEMALDVLKLQPLGPIEYYSYERSREYWLGYYLAFYQWATNIDFRFLNQYVDIEEMRSMYHPYHEMDITHFIDRINEILNERKKVTNLEIYRRKHRMSRSKLAKESNVPVRTIEHYEQRVANINKASAEYIISLAKALYVKPEQLLEVCSF